MRIEIEHLESSGSPLVTATFYDGDELLDTLTLCGPEGTDWEALAQEALALKNAPPAPYVAEPITVSPWQIRKALNDTNLRSLVETAVASADQHTKDGWEFATAFVENDPFVVGMFAQLGKTDEDRHAFFVLAQTL